MKIDQNLRAAIRSFCNANRNATNWEERRKQEKVAIANLLNAKPSTHRWWVSFAKRVKAAQLRKKAVELAWDKLETEPEKFGLQLDYQGNLGINWE